MESEGLYRDGVCLAFSSQGWETSAPDDVDDVAATVARLMPTIVILGHQGLLRLSRSASGHRKDIRTCSKVITQYQY
jgi:hypothetical protein